jgi:hypothetical protein
LTKINPENNALICGDFNAHHPWWNSRIRNGIRSDELIDWLEKFNFELVNEPDVMTFCRYQTNSNSISESVLDLSFARGNIISSISEWAIDEENASGSDHALISLKIQSDSVELVENQLLGPFNLEKANWKEFHGNLNSLFLQKKQHFDELKKIEHSNSENLQKLEEAAIQLTEIVQIAATNHIPKIKKSDKSKPWWNQGLNKLRKSMAQKRRQWKRACSNETHKIFQNARNSYFDAIKNSKQKSWNEFLINAQGKEIFKAFQYVKMRRIEKLPTIKCSIKNQEIAATKFEDKCKTFIYILFPQPPEIKPPN